MQTSTGPRRRGRPSGRAGADLLAVAREQFIAHGFRGTTMDAVAAGAGISKQTLYSAYPSKDELYAAVVRDWVEQGFDALRPHTMALGDSTDVRKGLHQLATVLQAGILSPPVLQMRRLVAAEADSFPHVAAYYGTRSWDHNLAMLAESLTVLTGKGLLAIDDPDVAAEQFVWLTIGAPLNRLSLRGASHGYTARRLQHTADEAVATFFSRYGGP